MGYVFGLFCAGSEVSRRNQPLNDKGQASCQKKIWKYLKVMLQMFEEDYSQVLLLLLSDDPPDPLPLEKQEAIY